MNRDAQPEKIIDAIESGLAQPALPAMSEARDEFDPQGHLNPPQVLGELTLPHQSPEDSPTLNADHSQTNETRSHEAGSGIGAWIRDAYRRHLGLSAGGAASATGSLLAGSVVAAGLSEGGLATSITLYAASFAFYYATFLPQMIWRDRELFKGEDGSMSAERSWQKAKEYAALIALTESWFAPVRIGLMNLCMDYFGTSPLEAQLYSFVLMNTAYFGGLPLLKEGLERFFKTV